MKKPKAVQAYLDKVFGSFMANRFLGTVDKSQAQRDKSFDHLMAEAVKEGMSNMKKQLSIFKIALPSNDRKDARTGMHSYTVMAVDTRGFNANIWAHVEAVGKAWALATNRSPMGFEAWCEWGREGAFWDATTFESCWACWNHSNACTLGSAETMVKINKVDVGYEFLTRSLHERMDCVPGMGRSKYPASNVNPPPTYPRPAMPPAPPPQKRAVLDVTIPRVRELAAKAAIAHRNALGIAATRTLARKCGSISGKIGELADDVCVAFAMRAIQQVNDSNEEGL